MKKSYLRQIIQEEIKEVMDAFGSLGAVDWGDPVASRQRRGEVKVGDILTMVDKNSPVYGQKGKVIRIYDSKEGVEVDFGSGNKYGIINRRIKGNKINESVNEAKYRVEYATQDGEKAKSRVYNSEEEADKKEKQLVDSGIKQAKVVKVEESVNEAKNPFKKGDKIIVTKLQRQGDAKRFKGKKGFVLRDSSDNYVMVKLKGFSSPEIEFHMGEIELAESVNEAQKFKNKEEVVDALVKDFGKDRKSYYNTPTNSNNEKYWTYNRTSKFYYDLVKKKGYEKSFDNMFKGTTPSDIGF